MSEAVQLRARTAICTLPTGAVGEGIALGLARRGWKVGLLGMASVPDALANELRTAGAAAHAVACEFDSRAAIADALEACSAALGRPELLVHGFPLYAAFAPRPLLDINEAGWTMACGSPMKAAMLTFQAAFDAFTAATPADGDPQPRSGRIVVVVPTFAMSGAKGHVLAASAAEGIRSLVKSAARQWGGDGITVNCLAVDPWVLLGEEPVGPEVSLAVPALVAGAPADDLAPAVDWLASVDAHFVTGQTLVLDGGTWMAR